MGCQHSSFSLISKRKTKKKGGKKTKPIIFKGSREKKGGARQRWKEKGRFLANSEGKGELEVGLKGLPFSGKERGKKKIGRPMFISFDSKNKIEKKKKGKKEKEK